MSRKYYQLFFEMSENKSWVLGDVSRDDMQVTDNWLFSRPPKIPSDSYLCDFKGNPFHVARKSGKKTDYTQAGFAGVPIGSFKVAKLLGGLEQVAMFPVEIEGYAQREPWYILHFWDVVDCLDTEKSQFRVIQPDDPIRPDLAGNYASVTKTRIDPAKVGDKRAFRIKRLEGTIVVSEDIKRSFENAGVTGAVFVDVTDD